MKIQNLPAPAQPPAKKRRLRGRRLLAPVYVYLYPDMDAAGTSARQQYLDKRNNVIADYDKNGTLIGIEILQPVRITGDFNP